LCKILEKKIIFYISKNLKYLTIKELYLITMDEKMASASRFLQN